MDRRRRVLLSVIVIVAVLAYLGFSIFSGDNLSYYVTVSEIVNGTTVKEPVNVRGVIVEGSTEWSPDERVLRFKLTDGVETIDVIYRGNMPGNYQDNTSAVVTGVYHDGLLSASRIAFSCPSKYKAAGRVAGG